MQSCNITHMETEHTTKLHNKTAIKSKYENNDSRCIAVVLKILRFYTCVSFNFDGWIQCFLEPNSRAHPPPQKYHQTPRLV